ncbi:MAG TPA: hypothetical protein VIG90_05290 [Pedomonas sp.]|uniref:hypothetical protein n=1 Tax=Pedomonas sp. TaxID=2976421 RepID=UPI002F42F536
MADSQKTFPLDELLLPFAKLPREYQSHLWYRGYRLTSAEIDVELPGNPGKTETLYGQELDLAPEFPVLHAYVENLKASGHTVLEVRVITIDGVKPDQLSRQSISLAIH